MKCEGHEDCPCGIHRELRKTIKEGEKLLEQYQAIQLLRELEKDLDQILKVEKKRFKIE